jgi:N-acetylglucosaminyl-diphospho-decaprenol L-rhamnosyltransferase
MLEPYVVVASHEAEHRCASGTCLILRRTCIEQVGLFDEQFGSYVEDVDLGLRAREAGWSVRKIPEARASGVGSVSLPSRSA